MEKFALIVAGGSGSRMGAEIPKQFLELAGKPVLMRTMERFAAYDPSIRLALVLPADQTTRWNELCHTHQFTLKHKVAIGGESRFQSVKNGLALLPADGLVFIHDGVRPLVTVQTLRNCEETAIKSGNALPVIPVVESLRQLAGDSSHHVDRSQFRLVQTPQTFRLDLIKKAYLQPESPRFTDDASVCEALGEKINLVPGNPENIKITHPADLKLAKYLWPGLD
ncbi:2-C-methyl-D-erythritol 4-phosphate cytidylyltransferase [Gaoshiqia sediminis]|uniref:2-C-methyl-D-erythritol 4-phosphate cytidylyltransferase n=1 Tax=Gaoshiqia sediminis TaxID=2986998 RepID=A0AA42C7S5_9BACT|nr:2-C-methyl-D-erythritol 4-phosphate cytidylyltransferase [Gaoshiqia sediminis]MCW0483859.1 2-C-methyl-D-erythritol 4-phosphate cytidylyltransferase [Gaoshiqia sediminis]